jgi:hypothetical protein
MDRILLFHLSDLHFGSGFHGTVDPEVGLGGHEIGLCEPLQLALKDAPIEHFQATPDDKLVYYIGGDLTRTGSVHDYQLVFTGLFSNLSWFNDVAGTPESLELGLPLADTYSIPGNHDHWKGQSVVRVLPWPILPPAYNAKIFPDLQRPTPWRQPIPSSNGKFILELFGLDSSEGLRQKRTNLRARGLLSQQELWGVTDTGGNLVKKGLWHLLVDAWQDETVDKIPRLRAVGCHHAFTNRNGLRDAWPLDGNSMADLLGLCRKYQVHAVLTGHTHYFLNWQQNPLDTGWYVWELRCGSTLQRAMATPNNPCTQPQPQGFLVHELKLAHNQPSWAVWKYQYGRNGTSHWKYYRDPRPEVIH